MRFFYAIIQGLKILLQPIFQTAADSNAGSCALLKTLGKSLATDPSTLAFQPPKMYGDGAEDSRMTCPIKAVVITY